MEGAVVQTGTSKERRKRRKSSGRIFLAQCPRQGGDRDAAHSRGREQATVTVLADFSTAVINIRTKSNLEGKGFISYSPSRQEPGIRNWSRGHRGELLMSSLLLACSVCLLIQPRTTRLPRDATAHTVLGPSIAIINQEKALPIKGGTHL